MPRFHVNSKFGVSEQYVREDFMVRISIPELRKKCVKDRVGEVIPAL